MKDYIFLQNKRAKTKILAKHNKKGAYTIKFGKGRSLEFDEYLEAELCTLVYTDYLRNDWVTWINGLCDESLSPDEIDSFEEKFKSDHPLTEVPEYQLSGTVELATQEDCCELRSPIFKQPIKLTLEQERTLLQLIATRYVPRSVYSGMGDAPNLCAAMQSFFAWYREQYGVAARYKKDMAIQDFELAYHFCLSHGIDFNYVNTTTVKLRWHDIISGVGWGLVALGGIGAVIFSAILILIGICKLL